jgi:AcrR family transcriptional regulator
MSAAPDHPLKQQVLAAAQQLFMERGYEAVGMREIAQAVGKQPVQIYRLKLSKSDILAELIIELNQNQITRLPTLCKHIEGRTVLDRVCCFLRELYQLDIEYLPIRSVGAAFGWMWSPEQEQRIIAQVLQLIKPMANTLEAAGLNDLSARCLGIWSLYYVGFRQAVIHGGTAEDCLRVIKPSLKYFVETPIALQTSDPVFGEAE